MSDLNSSPPAPRPVFAGMIDEWSHLLPGPERSAFVGACTEAGADDGPLQSILRRYFSTWKTSLMGDDLSRLQMLAQNVQMRDYINVICVEDESDDTGETTPSESAAIWPRLGDGRVAAEALGVGVLKAMLVARQLCPNRLQIRDKRSTRTPSDPETAAILARDILGGSNLAITVFTLQKESPMTTIIAAELSAEFQGQGIGFSILRKADLCFSQILNPYSYWADQILFHAPALKELSLSFWKPLYTRHIPPSIFDNKTWPALEKLEVRSASLSTSIIIAILSNSEQSLSDVSFRLTTLVEISTWKELLSRIGNEFPHLTRFNLGFLAEGSPGQQSQITFLDLEKDGLVSEPYKTGLKMLKKGSAGVERISRVEYEGPDASHVLRIVAECAVAVFR